MPRSVYNQTQSICNENQNQKAKKMGYFTILTLFALGTTLAMAHSVVFIPADEQQFEHLVRPLTDAPAKCDFKCTRVFEPICATNGQCVERFPNACSLSAYNCENPHAAFAMIEDWKCERNWAPMC